jgi:hypothetical protein
VIVGAAAIGCALALAGCGGSESEPAAATTLAAQGPGLFYASLIREKATGQYQLAWESLHPFHQRFAPRETYIQCENQTAFPGRLLDVSIVHVGDEPVQIAGEDHTVPAKAVTIKVSVDYPGISKPVVVTDTYHAISVNGHWTWILTRANFADYKAGQCPGAVPPPKA